MKTNRYSIYSKEYGTFCGIYAGQTEEGALVGLLSAKCDSAEFAREFRSAGWNFAAVAAGEKGEFRVEAWRFRELLSRTAAKRKAHAESHMYRQGSGWIVSTWDEAVKCNRTSHELPYGVASNQLAEWRRERTAYLCGENN